MDHQKKYNNKKTPELKTVSSSLAAEDEEERHINERRKDVGKKNRLQILLWQPEWICL